MLQNQPVTNWQTERVNHKYHNLSDNILQWDNKYNVHLSITIFIDTSQDLLKLHIDRSHSGRYLSSQHSSTKQYLNNLSGVIF